MSAQGLPHALDSRRAAQQWDKNARSLWKNWWDSPALRHYVNEQICGIPNRDDGVGYAIRQAAGSPLNRALSIGFGDGGKEISLLTSGIVRKFDLYEISAQQIARAKKQLETLAIADRADFLPINPLSHASKPVYDLIYWDHSLHHMFDVRATLKWCRDALAPKGIICINDYVGPTRLQWTRYETVIANAYLKALETKHSVPIPKIASGNAIKRARLFLRDPSEAPQSDIIERACTDTFPGFALRPLGGAMLNMCGPSIMNLSYLPEGLIEDFSEADRQCLKLGIYHFAFGIWKAA